MIWKLTIKAGDREMAVAIYRYLQKVFDVKKTDVERVDDNTFTVCTTKEIGGIMIKAINDKFKESK